MWESCYVKGHENWHIVTLTHCSTCGDLLEGDCLSCSAPQHHTHPVKQLYESEGKVGINRRVLVAAVKQSTNLFCWVQPLIWGEVLRESQGALCSWDNTDLEGRGDSVTCRSHDSCTYYSHITAAHPSCDNHMPSWWGLCAPTTNQWGYGLPRGMPPLSAPPASLYCSSSPYLCVCMCGYSVIWNETDTL